MTRPHFFLIADIGLGLLIAVTSAGVQVKAQANKYDENKVNAQEKLPEFGDIGELKGMRKVYVSAPSTEETENNFGRA